MYENNLATVLTQEEETDFFKVITGVLLGDPLATFLFIIRKAIANSDGIRLFKRRNRRHPPIHLADLDFADDIALLDEAVADAERLLHKVETATQFIGLFLNVKKTKYMFINDDTNEPSFKTIDGSKLEMV